MKKFTDLRVAIVHDNFKYFGGAEWVVWALHKIWPGAHVYTSTISWDDLGKFRERVKPLRPQTSWAQRIPFFPQFPFLYRYLLPFIWRTFDFSKYDVVISSSYAQMSHLIRVPPHVVHICYSHSPPRHLYGYETDFDWERFPVVRFMASTLNHLLRWLDNRAAQRVTSFVACSQEVAKRIKTFYKRQSSVIYPPLLHRRLSKPKTFEKGMYYLVVSRLSRRKHVDLVVRTCTQHKLPLKVVGSGPEESYLRNIAGPTVEFLGQRNVGLSRLYKHCIAVICTGRDEESSIVPIEALYYGRPTIAYRSGGYVESVIDGKTGILFDDLTVDNLYLALKKIEKIRLDKKSVAKLLQKFSLDTFESRIKDLIERKYHEHSLFKS